MQVSVETTSELSRKMTVQVPEDKVQEQVASRLKSLARKVKIDGFRPGKAPQSVINKRYASSVREEVLADLIQSSFYEAIQAEKLNPAAGPMITPQDSGEGQGLNYVADFEVVPEFVLMPLETLEVKRYVSEVTDEDLEAMVLRLREQRKTWHATGREAVVGDRLTITFEGRAEGEDFTNGKVENFQIVLGSDSMIPGFEDKLVGASVGAKLSFELGFPDEYTHEKLAGKLAQFEVEVMTIEEGVLPEEDAELARAFGVEDGDVSVFRADVKDNMQREMSRSLKSRTKNSVMDALYQAHATLGLPRVLVEQELKQLITPYQETAQRRNQSFDTASMSSNLEPVAKRRVALGLILNKIIEGERVKVDPGKVRKAIEEIAMSYENPEQVVQWYYSNQDQLHQVENIVIEDQAVDAVLAKAQVVEEGIAFKDLMQTAQPSMT